MKRKQPIKAEPPKSEPLVSPEILEGARRLASERIKTAPVKCVVCGSESASGGAEPLCWVCRRLKISAWRDVEQQMPAQE